MSGAMLRVTSSASPRAFKEPIAPNLNLSRSLHNAPFAVPTGNCEFPQTAFKDAANQARRGSEATRDVEGTVKDAKFQVLETPARKRPLEKEEGFLRRKRQKIQKQQDEKFEDAYLAFEQEQQQNPHLHFISRIKDIPDPPSKTSDDEDTVMFDPQSSATLQQQALNNEHPTLDKDHLVDGVSSEELAKIAKRFNQNKSKLLEHHETVYEASKAHYKARTHQNHRIQAFPRHAKPLSHLMNLRADAKQKLKSCKEKQPGIQEFWLASDNRAKHFPEFTEAAEDFQKHGGQIAANRKLQDQYRIQKKNAAHGKKVLKKGAGKSCRTRGDHVAAMHADETILVQNGETVDPFFMRPKYRNSPLRKSRTTEAPSPGEQSNALAKLGSIFFDTASKSWVKSVEKGPKYQVSTLRAGQRAPTMAPKEQKKPVSVLEEMTSRQTTFHQDFTTSAWSVKQDVELPPVFFD